MVQVIFIARQHTDARYWFSKSVRPSVCPLHFGIRWKRLNIYRHSFFHHHSASNIFTKFRQGHPMRGAKYRWGITNSRFSTNKSLYFANDARYRYSTILNDLEWPLTPISRLPYYSTSNNSKTAQHRKWHHLIPISRYISQTIQDIAIVTMEGE